MRHNKKRNTALLYEFLIRHVSKCLLESRNDEANKAVALLKKFFKSGPLQEELRLFDYALNGSVQTSEYASKLLGEVLKQARKLNVGKVDTVKTRLIKEINRSFDSDSFFAHKIPNYVMYASLQTLLNHATGVKTLPDPVSKLTLEERLVTHLLSQRHNKPSLQETLKLDPQYNNAVYKMVISKFNQKYAETLNEAQKKLLTKYAVSLISGNTKALSKTLFEEVERVKDALAIVKDAEIAKDRDLLSKIGECRKRLNEIVTEKISEPILVAVLQYMSLAEEVGS